MSGKTVTAAEVEIFGAVYHVRGDKDPERLQEVAGLVDRRMREIARQVNTVDTAKIAILAALNLSDELFQCRQQQEGNWGELQERVVALTGRLEVALERA
ncbi:MAG: cell division protein ZapA [Thermoanaerobaculia bacterium]